MQIVIEIPDRLIDNEFGYTDIRLHKDIKHINSITTEDYESPYFACLSFVVLPEHHGRLIDANRLMRVDHIILESQVDNARTIIETTEEVQE